MKNHISNHKGYALILVLLTITLIGIMSVPLVNSVVNSSKQNSLSEEQNQLVKTSEMGMDYFRTFIDKIEGEFRKGMKDGLEITKSGLEEELKHRLFLSQKKKDEYIRKGMIEFKIQYINDVYDDLYSFFSNSTEYVPDYFEPINLKADLIGNNTNYQFLIQVNPDDIRKENETVEDLVDSNNYYIEIPYISVASKSVDNSPQEKLTESLKIVFGDIGINGTTNPDYNYPEKPDVECKPDGTTLWDELPTTCVDGDSSILKSEDVTVDGSLFIEDDLDLIGGNQGKNGETTLTVENDLVVKGTLTIRNHTLIKVNNGTAYFNHIKSSPNASMTILGDAYIYGDTYWEENGNNKPSVCIKGTLFSKNDLSDIVNINPDLDCTRDMSGIHARSYQKIN